ncbi:MAG: hypothetical protein ACAH65_08680 [Chloroflexota bacterium]
MAAVAGGAFVLSRPSEPGLSDPTAILDAATVQLAAAQSVHFVADLDGTVSLGLFSPAEAGSAQPLTLTGTHADGDIDLMAREASLRFEVPALLGLTGRLVEMPDGTYLSSTLTGDGWISVGDRTGVALPGGEPLAQISNLRALLADPASSGTKLDDVDCTAGRCYQVRVWLTSEQVRVLFPSPAQGGASTQPTGPVAHTPAIDPARGTVDARVDRGSLRLSEALIHLDLGDGTAFDLDLRFSAWGAPVAIEAPPFDEVAPSASPAPAL